MRRFWLSYPEPNTYEAPSCQETNYPCERFFRFFRLWIPGVVSRRCRVLT